MPVAGIDFIGERQSVRRHHQRHHHLRAVGAVIAAVAATALAGGIGRWRIGFEIGAGQVVEQHVELRLEQLAPAIPQMLEQSLAVRRQQVQATIQLVFLRQREVLAEQIGQGAAVVPLAMETKLAAGVDQAVGDQRLEHVRPASPLAAGRQPRCPELVQPEQAPKMQRQPAGAELSRPAQSHAVHADAHHFAVQLGKRVAVVGKQGKLARRFGAVGEGFDGAHPAGALAVVELAEVQQMALDHASAAHATAFDDAPVAVLFAVFVAGPRAQEHGSSLNL